MPKKQHCSPPSCYNSWIPPFPSHVPSSVNTILGPRGEVGPAGPPGVDGTQLSVGPMFPAAGTSRRGAIYISDAGIIYCFDGTNWNVEYMLPTRTHVLNSQYIFTLDEQVGNYLGLASINGDFSNVSVPVDSAVVVTKFGAKITLGSVLAYDVIVQLQLWTGTGKGENTASLNVPISAGSSSGSATIALQKSLNPFDGVSVLYLGVIKDGDNSSLCTNVTKGVVVATTVSYQAP